MWILGAALLPERKAEGWRKRNIFSKKVGRMSRISLYFHIGMW